MTGIWRRLTGVLSATLDSAERDAVLGDLAERGETGVRALRQVLGLVVRRQAALWTGWRPWLSLIGLAFPLGWALSVASRRTAHVSAIYIWMYANNWDWSLLANSGFRQLFAHYLGMIFVSYATLACWSVTGGFVLGSVARRSTPVNGMVLALTVFLGVFLGAPPRHFGQALYFSSNAFNSNAAVFDLTFYRVVFPPIVQAVLVLLPSVWGMRKGLNWRRTLSLRGPALLLLLAGIAGAAGQATVRAVVQPANTRRPAPQFALKDSSGKTLKLKKYRGKVVLLDFWATWCHGCKEEIPWFAEFHRKYAARGLAVLGVSLDEDGWKVVKPFLAGAKVPYRILLGDDATARKYGITNMPDTYLIDRKGRIAATYSGLVDKDDVETNIQAMLSRR